MVRITCSGPSKALLCSRSPRVPLGWGGGGGATWAATRRLHHELATLQSTVGWLFLMIRASILSQVFGIHRSLATCSAPLTWRLAVAPC